MSFALEFLMALNNYKSPSFPVSDSVLCLVWFQRARVLDGIIFFILCWVTPRASCLGKQGMLLLFNLSMEKAVLESSDTLLSLIQTGYGWTLISVGDCQGQLRIGTLSAQLCPGNP